MTGRDGATTIVYNGVTMTNVLTDSIDQTVQLDQTGTDPIYVLTVATFTAVLHTEPYAGGRENTIGIEGAMFSSDSSNPTLQEAYTTIIPKLMQPRRQFIMTIGGKTVFNIVPGTEWVVPANVGNQLPLERIDCNHGPIPSVRVLSVVSARTMRIQFTIRMHVAWTDKNATQPHGVTSFRFWMAEDINCEDWTTARVYHGRVRVKHLGYSVLMEFKRYFWCPALQLGFVRRKIAMQETPNGLELEFEIQDQEVWAVPPPPATHWMGSHTIAANVGMSMLESNIEVQLTGPKNCGKRALMAMCWRVVCLKLHISNQYNKGQDFVTRAVWVDHLPDNRVGASATVKHISPTYPMEDFCLPLDELRYPLVAYSTARSYLPGQTATLKGIMLAWLCDPKHVRGPIDYADMPTKTPPSPTGSAPPGGGTGPYPNNVDPSSLSNPHTTAGMFNVYRMASDVDIDRGAIVLPFAAKSATGDENADEENPAPAAGQATAAIVYTHNGFATRTVLIEAERLEAWPTLPRPVDFKAKNNIQHWILSDHPHASAPQLSADFTKTLYHIDYTLRYALERVPDYSKAEYMAALLPYRTETSPQIRIIPATAFVDPASIL